jgi:hypothetical protein
MEAITGKSVKAHRAPQAGPKAEKRKKADKKKRGLSVDKVNRKARAASGCQSGELQLSL